MALPDPQVHDFPGSQRNFDALVKLIGTKATAASVAAAIAAARKVTTYPASIIATTESRTNVAYGTLTTPDQVAGVVLPANGLIVVRYQATWQESVQGAARAAIFIGSNQLKVAASGSAKTSAAILGTTTAANDAPLATCPTGLIGSGLNTVANYSGDVTTGQAIAVATDGSNQVIWELGGSSVSQPAAVPQGDACSIFAAAGTYTISVQFKSSSGSVTAKTRKLWVEVHDYS